MTRNLKKFGLILSLSLFAISSVVYAGTLTPSATPAATFYTLGDIYTRLTTNASATLGNHDFAPGGSPGASLYTLTQIYDAVPTIDASKVKLGTSYLGVAGSLVPNGGTATAAGLFNGLTAHLSGDWSLDTGTLDLACNTATFNGTANIVATAYDGSGDGTNRWCMKETGDAVAGNILSGKVAWVDGLEVTGTIATQTLAAASATVNAGYYEATTLNAVDSDLTAANILSGTTIFGVAGSATAGYTYSTGPRTGQTICYNATGSVVACSDTGQDGEALKGVARSYTASNVGSDYIVTDNVTGLVWQKCSKGLSGNTCATGSATTDTWANALTYCNALDFAGQTDWRLPNVYELYSIMDFGKAGVPFADATYFPATVSATYWSSTSRPASGSSAMNVSFGGGSAFSGSTGKSGTIYIRCVRG